MKYLLTVLIVVFACTLGISQADWMVKKANEKVEELNEMITSENPDLALTQEQREKIYDLHLQKHIDIKAIKDTDLSDEEKEVKKKEVYKKVGKTISNEILTKEQRKAKRAAREKMKEE